MSTKEASRLKGADDIPRRREVGRSDISINLIRIFQGLASCNHRQKKHLDIIRNQSFFKVRLRNRFVIDANNRILVRIVQFV